jgi:hypothetical protein
MLLATLLQLQLTTGNDLIFQLTNTAIFTGLVKLLFIIGAILYVIFSFVVVRQITLMRQTVITSLSSVLQLLGYLHFVFAVGVVILFFIIL